MQTNRFQTFSDQEIVILDQGLDLLSAQLDDQTEQDPIAVATLQRIGSELTRENERRMIAAKEKAKAEREAKTGRCEDCGSEDSFHDCEDVKRSTQEGIEAATELDPAEVAPRRRCDECDAAAVTLCGGKPKCESHTREHVERVRSSAMDEVKAALDPITQAERKEEADALRAEAGQHEQDAADSFERSDTDGFLSQWASQKMASLKRAEAEIAGNGGEAYFVRTLLTNEGGVIVREARVVETRFGTRWVVGDGDAAVWMPYKPARPSTLAKRGFREIEIRELAPAKAIHWAPPGARGMSGATQVRTITIRTDRPANERWTFDGFEPKEDPARAEIELARLEADHGEWLDKRIAGELPILLGTTIEGSYGQQSWPWIFDAGATVIPSKKKRADGRIWISGPGRSYSGDPVEGVRAVVSRADLLEAIAEMSSEVERLESAAGWDRNP
jgi:hypothetical protein